MKSRKQATFVIGAVLALSACSGERGSDPVISHTSEVAEEIHWPLKTLPELVEALEVGEVSAETLTQAYLDRIDRIETDYDLNAILALNPEALAAARAIDARRAAGQTLPQLAGIPILLKDNIETADLMPTTAGSLALADNFAAEDAPLAANLRARGAIILGKTNLSEWANFRSSESQSGWSAIGGRAKNPHALYRQTCGSSAGSGAAAAAALAAATVGTETNGSIICPAQANGVVGFKPTLGLISQQGIVPIAFSQDTAGPMTRTVTGAALLLSGMTEPGAPDFSADLSKTSLSGARVGVLRFSVSDQPGMAERFDDALAILAGEGAELVEITEFELATEDYGEKSLSVLLHEFKTTLNAYLAETPETVETRTLADLIAFNEIEAERELGIFGQDLFERADATGGIEDADYQRALADIKQATGANGIDKLLADYDVNVLVSPSGPIMPLVKEGAPDEWPAWSGAGYLAAVAGYPHLTVPMGQVDGVPVGLSFMSTANADAEVLSFGYDYEQASQLRSNPAYRVSTGVISSDPE